MKTRQNKYSIRKFSVGTASALIGALLFIGGGQAQAEESQEQTSPETTQAQSIDNKSDETQQSHSTTQDNQPTIHKAQKPSQSENKQKNETITSDKHSENSDENKRLQQQEHSNVDHSRQETPKSSEQTSSETQPSSKKTDDTTSEVTDKHSDKKENQQEGLSDDQQKNAKQEDRSDAEQLNEDKGFNTQLYDHKEEQTNKKSEHQPRAEKEDKAQTEKEEATQTSEINDEDKSTETQPTSHVSTEHTSKSDETTTEDKDEKDVATKDSTETQTEEAPQTEENQPSESKGDNDSSEDEQNNEEESTKEASTKDDERTEQQPSEGEEDTSSLEKSQEDSTEEKATEAQPKTDEPHDVSQSNETETSSSEVASTEESTSEDQYTQQTEEVPTEDTSQQSEENRNDENRFPLAGERTSEQTQDRPTTQQQPNRTVSLEDLENTPMLPGSSQNQDDKQQQKELAALKANSQATTNNNNTKLTPEATTDQTNKVAKQAEYKNEDPIILVHGFNSFVGENADGENNWGGEVLDIGQYLENNGYESYQASISAYGSNYDRAVELYYYIKGGTVDYGAAHAEKYGHARYGKTYEGVYKDWQPGQKVHLVGHSMGGQTVRYLEEMLRNGNQEEIEYQRQHGGEISPLYQGGHDNMVSSITTVVTPHNGTHAADLLGNEDFIRQVAYDYITLNGSKTAKVDFGLSQWGLKQREDETYLEYVDRVKKTSKIWTTKDNAFYDLTTQGAEELNNKTTLNPNIVYKTYTGESTYEGLNGEQKADIHMALSKILTANVIGKVPEKEWRENDGLVSVISAQHPFVENSTAATDQVQKGIWQVTPTRHDWDHSDFVGHDKTEQNVDAEELKKLWGGIAEDAVKAEHVVG